MAQLPDIGVRSVQQQQVDSTLENTLHLVFRGHLASIVTTIVDPENLGWIEATTIDVASSSASFTITPTHYAKYFRCAGTWAISPQPGRSGRSLRIIEGTMKVTSPMPFVNGQVERAIVSGLRERLDREAPLLEAWLRSNPADPDLR